jgi:3-oxoadipate enol-lactonase
MGMVHVNGWEFDCQLHGEGPDLVFIHGEIHGAEYWEHQIAEFSKDHRCLIYNRRGHARTGAPDFGYSLENQTRDLEGLIAHFGMQRPAIVAIAFGTTIAANYAIRHPGDVRALTFVAWSELHDAMLYFDRWVKASEQVVAIMEKDGREAVVEFMRREAGRSLYMVINKDSPIREECIQLFTQHPLHEYRTGMLEFATSVPDLIRPLETIATPALGVCGDKDPFPDQPGMLAGMVNFREAPMIAGAGRFVQWERPDEFNALLREFLAAHP